MERSRTREPFDEFEQPINPKETLQGRRFLDRVPLQHEESIEDGYNTVVLAPGQQFFLDPMECAALEPAKVVKQAGIAIETAPIAIIYLSAEYPLVLFDGGNDINLKPQRLIDLKDKNKPNVTIAGRFFLISEEAFMQIQVSKGMQTGIHGGLRGYGSFNIGQGVTLGRDYEKEFNSHMPQTVSGKHLAIEAWHDGRLVFTDTYSKNRTKIQYTKKSV